MPLFMNLFFFCTGTIHKAHLHVFTAVGSVGGTSMGCRAEIRTRACLTASLPTEPRCSMTNGATLHPYQLSHIAPWQTELRCTLPTEPRCTLRVQRNLYSRCRRKAAWRAPPVRLPPPPGRTRGRERSGGCRGISLFHPASPITV